MLKHLEKQMFQSYFMAVVTHKTACHKKVTALLEGLPQEKIAFNVKRFSRAMCLSLMFHAQGQMWENLRLNGTV